MGPLILLLAAWGYKAGFVTGLLGSFQNKPGVYSSSWVTLQICLSVNDVRRAAQPGPVCSV